MKNKIALIIVLVFALMQLFNPDEIIAPESMDLDYFTEVEASDEVMNLIQTTCYDCHSLQPKMPWYSKVAPVSWWINDHIEHGSHHLNFSDWANYNRKEKAHKMEECYEMIEEDEMPLYSYTILHGDAKFSDEQKEMLISFFKAQEEKYN